MDQRNGCLCGGKKQKSNNFPKTFLESKQILAKYQQNNLEILDDDILDVLIRLYVADNKIKPIKMLTRCRINPNIQRSHFRNDLEYYIPQLINFVVFHQQLKQEELVNLIIKASQIDFFFAHLVYFQLNSLSEIVGPKQTYTLKVVKDFLQIFESEMIDNYRGTLLIASQILQIHFDPSTIGGSSLRQSLDFHSVKQSVYRGKQKQSKIYLNEPMQIREYGGENYDEKYLLENAGDIDLIDYSSNFQENQVEESFRSTISFWEDMIYLGNNISAKQDKTQELRNLLHQINHKLPAAVYVPFFKYRNFVILKIVANESKVFSTKMRSPFSLSLELYKPEGEANLNFDQQISIPLTTNMAFQRKQDKKRSSIIGNKHIQDQMSNELLNIKFQQRTHYTDHTIQEHCGISKFYYQDEQDQQEESLYRTYSRSSDGREELESSFGSKVSYIKEDKGIHLSRDQLKEMKQQIFGESLEEQEQRIKANSPFKQLKTWTLAHLIVKTGDNLKQEQFALQLICQFDQIFRKEGLSLRLRHYEVLSLGPDSGIIQMIKNATTIDGLQRNLHQKYQQFQNFSDFFRSFFRDNIQQALNNYLHSLVAYSLVCYFLQVKDRHNGNILLDTEGHLIHIDFGFFLSIAPGKGLEFEKKVPFKLLSDYIQVLGGVKGELFQKNFRNLFFQGFKAAQKHQKEILLLVEMMYTGHGTTLPCLSKGEAAIRELSQRFNPQVASEGELYVFVQQLINSSLDHWRAKWYDKFQYFVQGVFY